MNYVKSYWRTSALIFLALLSVSVQADPTHLKVLVRADDSKFIGSGVGGMNIRITRADSGELLAEGELSGATGDTQALMQIGQVRGQSPATADAASFIAVLDLDSPTRIKVNVSGPRAVEQSQQEVSTTLWMVPGRHRVDPGLVLHMPGLIVDLDEYKLTSPSVSVTANVTMMCGCPITADGLWNSNDYDVVAQLFDGDQQVSQALLAFTGNTNEFSGQLLSADPEGLKLVVYAYQKSTGNTGVFEQVLQAE
ncbi:MAG TPA: hypothetical protein VIC08_00085 [Cellvibrionaceae bacterium]